MRLLLGLVFAITLYGETIFKEEFNTLTNWEEVTFQKVEKHSKYTVENSLLIAESNNSASGIKLKRTFNIYEHPILKFRWKVENIYKNGDATSRKGDDYPIRIYVVFDALFDKSLNYIWSNRDLKKRVLPNSYSGRSMMIVMNKGEEGVGEWVEHTVNLRKDYREAFGSRSPKMVTIAIMNDSDNTGESSTSYIDYLEISSE